MEKPFVSIAIIRNDNQEYLLIKRANEPYKDQWSFISGIGASQKGLPPEEAVRDEVQYDIGTDFVGKLLYSYELEDVPYADRVYVFLGKVAEKSIVLNPDAATHLRWFTDQELEEAENLAFDNKKDFENVINKIN